MPMALVRENKKGFKRRKKSKRVLMQENLKTASSVEKVANGLSPEKFVICFGKRKYKTASQTHKTKKVTTVKEVWIPGLN